MSDADDFDLVYQPETPRRADTMVDVGGILMDRRQLVVAAQVLMALDLPQPLAAWAAHCARVAELVPGMTVDDMQLHDTRVGALQSAVRNLDRLISEAGGGTPGPV